MKGTAIGWLTRLFATYDSQASFGSLFRTGPKEELNYERSSHR